MIVKSVLLRPQGLRSRARAPTCPPPLATPLGLKDYIQGRNQDFAKEGGLENGKFM